MTDVTMVLQYTGKGLIQWKHSIFQGWNTKTYLSWMSTPDRSSSDTRSFIPSINGRMLEGPVSQSLHAGTHILLPNPPVVETLDPTLTDDSLLDQILSSVFEDYLQQGIPSAHTQEPQVLDTGPSLFDESNHLISFLDYSEAGLALEQQEAPMD
ncbi:hypothetical protein TNCV_1235161 [Trichonephila clavipes]|nr:hypothetical protein TNCV_1235161 [Trichonephila clavipes]